VLILVALLLLFVLDSPWNLIGAAVFLVLWFFELAFWNRTVKNRRRVVGAQTLVGRTASVIRALDPEGQVKVDGEIWAARASSSGAGVGDMVRIVGRDNLVLVVEPAAEGPG
jgi:membrane-bound serine protease (ClpP class)